MILCGIASLLLSTTFAGVAPVLVAVKPGTVGVLPKGIKTPKQEEKVQPAKEESNPSLTDKGSELVPNVFAVPVRDATVQLKISGFSQLDLVMNSQKKTNNDKSSISNTPHLYNANTNLKFETSVKKEKMEAGWLIRFNPQLSTVGDSLVDRNGIFLKHDDMGQVDAGNIKGVDDSLFKLAQGLIGGTGFWDGSLDKAFYAPDKSYCCEGVDFVGSTHTATKISYVTPKLGDVLTLAASYTPNTSHRGQLGMTGLNQMEGKGAKSKNNPGGFTSFEDGKHVPYGTNNITLVARLDKECGDWTVGGAFAYIHDNAEVWAKNDIKESIKYSLKDTNAFGVSGVLGYRKFKIGFEFMNNGKSRLPTNDDLYKNDNFVTEAGVKTSAYEIKDGDKGDAGKVFTVVAQYKWTDKLTSALAFQRTHRKLNADSSTTRNTFAKTVNYSFMPGLEGYIETDLICLERKDSGIKNKENSNSGMVVMAGVRVKI